MSCLRPGRRRAPHSIALARSIDFVVSLRKAENRVHTRERVRTKAEPGLSLLRLAQAQVEAASASIRNVCSTRRSRAGSRQMLPAAVEILLAAGDLRERARCRRRSSRRSQALIGYSAPLGCVCARHGCGAPGGRRPSRAHRHRCARPVTAGGTWRCRTKRRRPVCWWPPTVNGGTIRKAVALSWITRDGFSEQLNAVAAWRASQSQEDEARASPTDRSANGSAGPSLVAAGRRTETSPGSFSSAKKPWRATSQNLRQGRRVEPRGATAWAYQHNLNLRPLGRITHFQVPSRFVGRSVRCHCSSRRGMFLSYAEVDDARLPSRRRADLSHESDVEPPSANE